MARAEDEKSLAGLLRHELRRRQPAEECPDAEALATYFEGAIEERERESLDRHFSDCARCRDALAVLARVGQEAVQQFAAAAAAAAPARAATSAPAQAVRELPRTPWWNWNWRLAVPLAALAILTVWMAREPAQVRTPVLSAENTTVASNANPAAGPPPVESVQNQQGLRSEPAGNLPDARSKIAATEKANRGPARENKPSRGAIGRM
ncbi:MAG: hypothetical protein ACRETH_10235, partial [Steroidobacteraceae bacterium]